MEEECFWVNLREDNKVFESKMAVSEIQDGRNQDGCHHQFKSELMSLSQIELVWVRIRVEEESFWVNLREDNKVFESKMAVSESNMDKFKMDSIIKLIQNDWVKFFCGKWLNPRWPPSSSWVRMNDFESDWISWSQSFEQNGWIQDIRIQDGRIQDGCHHQFKSELMSLSQIELVWVRIRVEWRVFLSESEIR